MNVQQPHLSVYYKKLEESKCTSALTSLGYLGYQVVHFGPAHAEPGKFYLIAVKVEEIATSYLRSFRGSISDDSIELSNRDVSQIPPEEFYAKEWLLEGINQTDSAFSMAPKRLNRDVCEPGNDES